MIPIHLEEDEKEKWRERFERVQNEDWEDIKEEFNQWLEEAEEKRYKLEEKKEEVEDDQKLAKIDTKQMQWNMLQQDFLKASADKLETRIKRKA